MQRYGKKIKDDGFLSLKIVVLNVKNNIEVSSISALAMRGLEGAV